MEVEQIGFDREGVGAEGGSIAYVGDCVEGFAGVARSYSQSRDVDAVCGE